MNHFSSIICGDWCTFSISYDNTIYSFGRNELGKLAFDNKISKIEHPTQIPSLTNIKQIDCGTYHTLCISFEGDIYSFGNNNSGQLGISRDLLKYTQNPQKLDLPPIQQICCGYRFNVCISYEGDVYTFGDNSKGQLGIGHKSLSNSINCIPEVKDIKFIVCGGYNVICRNINNEYYIWGNGSYGQFGNGTCSSFYIPTKSDCFPKDIISIKCGLNHVICLTLNGKIYVCGDNNYGQLGVDMQVKLQISTFTIINDIPFIIKISCGTSHSMCIDENNILWLFGSCSSGQLGLGDTLKRCKPTKHPSLEDIIDISSGGYHTFVKTSYNKIFAFGTNTYSQLGIKTINDKQLIPIEVFKDKKHIWRTNINNRAKSARK